jgi:CubicO group peptidase (beta-lactamase class C family)
MNLNIVDNALDFAELDARMQSYVDRDILGCLSTVVLRGTEIVHARRHGWMDVHERRPLANDAIFRMYSNTKLITSVALMLLYDEGKFALDDPLAKFLPTFSTVNVLKTDAQDIEDTEPLKTPITLRHILSHSAGLSYGFLEPDSLIDKAYIAAKVTPVSEPNQTLESLAQQLSELPLCYQPGTSWRYSFASDLCARVVEVLTGERFDTFLRTRIFEPLAMTDTDFWVPPAKQDRLVTMYTAPDLMDGMKSGFDENDPASSDRRALTPTFLSGGGGLLSTIVDYTTFIQMIIAGGSWNGERILRTDTLELMRTNQLNPGVHVHFPMFKMPDTVFGLGFAIKTAASQREPQTAVGEYYWGGMAGTHSWVSPSANLAGLCFTQRMPGFWHRFSHDFRTLVYAAGE